MLKPITQNILFYNDNLPILHKYVAEKGRQGELWI
jgi:hypothetical protein